MVKLPAQIWGHSCWGSARSQKALKASHSGVEGLSAGRQGVQWLRERVASLAKLGGFNLPCHTVRPAAAVPWRTHPLPI